MPTLLVEKELGYGFILVLVLCNPSPGQALRSSPAKPVACNSGCFATKTGLLYGIVSCCCGLLGVQGIPTIDQAHKPKAPISKPMKTRQTGFGPTLGAILWA